MTETAGLIRDLVWVPDVIGEKAETPEGIYQVYQLGMTSVFGAGFAGSFISKSQGTLEQAKEAAQTDFETRILSTLNLDAFRAQIKAETLEELAAYCDKYQVGVNPRSGYTIDEFCAPEGTHPGMAYAAEFRKMKGSPS